MKDKFKKQISLLLTVSLLFFYVIYPMASYAQVVTPTDTPTPTVTDNNATVSTNSNTTSNTGSNAIDVSPTPTDTPSPTPTDTPTPSPTPDPSITPTDTPTPAPDGVNISNTATVSSTLQSDANTGNNAVTSTGGTDHSQPNTNNSSLSTPNSTIATGNATSSTSIVSDVNTNSVNSSVINQTLNIFVAQNGSIDLSDPFTIASNAISTHPEDSVINVSVTNVNNFAYVTNDVASAAITGENLINTPDQSAAINSGNAFSAVSLLNKVNFTVVNSQIHLITINIFGNLNGNIILPNPNTSTDCSGCGINTSINNTAEVVNNLSSTADTGDNSIIASGSATISTGNAQSTINNLNLINTNVLGTNAEILYINNFGTWNGNFIGWGNFDPTAGGASLVFTDFSPNQSGSSSGQTNINNTALVQNNVSSLAFSGGNSINGGRSSIATGNSFSAISLMNFINTNFINSFGFFGFINIFGNWTGNIGGASQFAALDSQGNSNPPPLIESIDNTTSNDSPSTSQEQGGQLTVENTNNVGSFVYPGDTVTFIIKVKNTGTGKVHGTKLNLNLILNQQVIGTTSFNLGDIDAQKGKKITTGIVLPKNSLGGIYTAKAVATGNTGPDDNSLSVVADSNFNVLNNFTAYSGTTQIPHIAVLSAKSKGGKNALATKSAQSSPYLLVLILVLLTYFLIRGIKKRRYLANLLANTDFKTKLSSIRMFLF
jgi:hypothetical protein